MNDNDNRREELKRAAKIITWVLGVAALIMVLFNLWLWFSR